MNGRAAARIESSVDAGAAALFAAAVAYALDAALGGRSGATIGTLGGEALAFGLCFAGLSKIAPAEPRFEPERGAGVAEPAAQARVIPLFTPDGVPQPAPPDASQSLLDALAELRSSLN